MLVRALTIAAVITVAGCAKAPVATPGPAERGVDPGQRGAWYAERFAEGRAVYEQSCASCHDPGNAPTPAIGVREDWDNRSRHWTAVLFEHAKAGYLDMPAKGGAPGLTDKEAAAAAEYILTVTYPELPVD